MLYLYYNKLKLKDMKKNLIIGVFQLWVIGLGILAIGGIAIVLINLLTGNYGSTASFTF